MTSPRLNATLRLLGFSALTAAFFSYLPANDSSCLFSGAACAAAEGEVREWTDSTGKFKVKAALVFQDAKNVRLRKENGRTVTMPFSKLSKQDLAYLSDLKKAEDSKKPLADGVKSEGTGAKNDGAAAPAPAETAAATDGSFKLGGKSQRIDSHSVDVRIGDLSSAKPLAATSKAEWKVKLEAPQRKSLAPRSGLKIGANLKNNSFLNSVVLAFSSPNASEIYAGYHINDQGKNRSFLERFDLVAGSSAPSEIPGFNAKLMDVSPDGKYALTIEDLSEDVGPNGRSGLLGIYALDKVKWGSGAVVEPVGLFYPFGANARISTGLGLKDARWIDASHILTKSDNGTVCWDLSTGKAVYAVGGGGAFSISQTPSKICLDPSRRVLGDVTQNACSLYDALTGETLGVVTYSGEVSSVDSDDNSCAFSPSGKKFAASFGKQLYVVDSATGFVVAQFEVEAVMSKRLLWSSDDYLFVGDVLYDVELGLPLCSYSMGNDRNGFLELGGQIWLSAGLAPPNLVGCTLPHKAALDAKKKLTSKEAFALCPGAHVAIKVETNGLLNEGEVRKLLEKKLTERKFVLDPKSKVVVKWYAFDTKKEESIFYNSVDSTLPISISSSDRQDSDREKNSGSVKLKIFGEGVDVYDGNKKLFSFIKQTFGPKLVNAEPDKKIEDTLRESNAPVLDDYDILPLPRYLSRSGREAGMSAEIEDCIK